MIKFAYLPIAAGILLILSTLDSVPVQAPSLREFESARNSLQAHRIPVDTEASIISWKGTKMGGKHEGTVRLREGYLEYKNTQITGGAFIADMQTIAVRDIPKHELVPRRRLRDHLKSEDFFYVEKYPTARFVINAAKAQGDGTFTIRGDLSIRDVTKSIAFTASQQPAVGDAIAFFATFTINRFDWNVAYQGSYWARLSSIFDNNFVHEEIELSIRLVVDASAG